MPKVLPLALPIALFASLGTTPSVYASTGPSADEVRAIVSEMLADADTRSSLQSSGGTAGHDGRFYLSSPGGDFRLNLGGYTQFRYMATFGDDLNGVTDNDDERGFKFQRTRLIFGGMLYDSIDFLLLPYAGPDGSWSILDAWAKTKLGDSGWTVQWGQFKLPFYREWLISERFNQMVERSDLNSVFSSSYAQGIQLSTTTDDYRVFASYSDGLQTLNTDYNSNMEADYAITARGEYKFSGNWGQFADMTSLGNEESGFMVGAAVHHQGRTTNFRGTDIDRLTQYTVDLNYEDTDWNATAAFIGRNTKQSVGGTVNDYGFLAQGGVFTSDKLEFFGRYTLLMPDGDATGDDDFNTITAGFNYYLHGHAAKFAVDGVWYLDDPNMTTMIGFGSSTETGLLSTTDDGQFSIRAQFQLIF